MALAARAPDIILRTSIPHEATSDQPLASVSAPPESASNDPVDQTAGVAKEMTAEELAAATAARKDAGPDADPKADGKKIAADGEKPGETEKPPTLEFDALPENLPGYAVREITKHRKQAQAKADAAWEAARAGVGEEAWNKAVGVARDAAVETAQKAAKDAAAEAKASRERADAIEKELTELRAKVPTTEPEVKADPRPARDQFDDPDEYDEALTQWGEREGERKAQAKVDEQKAADDKVKVDALAEEKRKADEAAATAQEAANAKLNDEWQAKLTVAREKHEDYDALTSALPADGGPEISEAMAAAIFYTDNGPDVAYYLAQNTDEALRIAKLGNPIQHMLEIARLAERLATPPRRAARTQPIEPVDTSSAPAGESDAEPEMADYYNRRTKAMQQTRQPFFPAGGIH